jgi:uncharacterized membrane protein
MEARAKLMGHPIHQMLIVLPLGLLSGVVIFDLLHLLRGGDQWHLISYWLIAAGVVAGLASALFGVLDWMKIPSRSRECGSRRPLHPQRNSSRRA